MAIATFTVPNFTLTSTFYCYNTYGTITYSTPTKPTSTQTFATSSIPAGSTIHSATASFSASGSLYGGTTWQNDNTSKSISVAVVVGQNTSIEYAFKSQTGGTSQGNKAGTITFSNLRIVVDYTQPTAATLSKLKIDNSSNNVYKAANNDITLSWTAAGGTNNPIKSFTIQRSANGGSFAGWKTGVSASARSYSTKSHATPGQNYKYRIVAVADYGAASWVSSPIIYSYSQVTQPQITISKTSCYTDDPFTIQFSGAQAGVGVSIQSYSLYQAETVIQSGITTSPISLTAPSTPGTYVYKVMTIGSNTNYNSSFSNTVSLVVEAKNSSFTVNNVTASALGDSLRATIVPIDSVVTHKIRWSTVKSQASYTSGWQNVTNAGTAQNDIYDYIIPKTWAKSDPASDKIDIKVEVETYSQAVKIGDTAVKQFSVNVPSSIVPSPPSVPADALTPIPALASFPNVFLVSNSKLQITLGNSNNNESDAVSQEITIQPPGQQQSYTINAVLGTPTTTSTTLNAEGQYLISAVSIDARNRRSTQITVGVVNVYPYNAPSFQFEVCRRDPETSGTQFVIKASVTVDKRAPLGTNAVQAGRPFTVYWREKGQQSWSSSALANNTLSTFGVGAINIAKAYEVKVSAGDRVYNTTVESSIQIIPPVSRAFDFRNDRAQLGRITSQTQKTFILPDDWQMSGGRYKSLVPTGTPPLEVDSSTVVTNLNADLLDGNHASAFATTNHNHNTLYLGITAQAVDSDKLDGVHLADIRLGQNILHNWDFRNPVNQRGVSGAISADSYFFDRWIRNSGTVTVEDGYLTLASGAEIEQRIEGNLLAGIICTVSFEVGSTIYHGSGTFPTSNGTVSVEVDGYPNITFGCATGYMFVLIPATSNTSIKRFKCEMGFVSTLHLDPPMEYTAELQKCYRYFSKTSRYRTGYVTGTGTGYVVVEYPVPMRINPTYTNNATENIWYSGGGTGVTCALNTVSSYRENAIVLSLTAGGHQIRSPLVSTVPFVVQLSADL